MNGGRSRRRIGLLTAFATLLSYAITSLPAQSAHAADPETTALKGLVTSLDGFVHGLAGVGSFGTPLTTLDVAPGSARGIGLDDLLSNAETHVLGSGFTSADDVDALTSAIDGANGAGGDISNDRHVTYTAHKTTAGTVDSIAVTMHATRTVTNARLDINDDSPKFSLASDGGVDLTLTMDLAYILNWDSNTNAVWLTRTTSTPSMSIAADGALSSPLAVKAGLGILGIELASGSTYQLHETSTTSWSDPNSDGRLAFDEPNGTPGDGELAAAGAGAGLVTATTTSGTLHAQLNIVGRPSLAISLGQAKVSVDVDDGDLTAAPGPQVTVTDGSLDNVSAFLTLSTRDLAQGLAQAASTVLGLERATGVKLPFMRGDVADAVAATQAITDYLTTHVPAPTPDQPTPGLPDFASLQDMLEQLDAITGANNVDVSGATYDATKKKVSFTLDITHDAPAAPGPDLNPTGTPISGTANYAPTKLTDTGKAFDATLVGRQVNAGTSSGVIASVNDDTLTLSPDPVTNPQNPNPTNFWNGGTPPDGTAYSIAAADPKIGAVELGDALSDGANGAIRNANAKSAQATVRPSFSLHLPIVLDLRDAETSDCDPGPGTAACPFSYQPYGPDGLTQVITSLPRTADRIMLHTSNAALLTADAPIATKVDINATVGFLGVRLTGDLKECTTSGPTDCTGSPASGDHLLTIALKPVEGADTDGDIPFPAYVTKITQALAATPPTFDHLVDVTVKGQAWAHLEVSVPGAPDFFGGSPTAGVDVTLADISAPAGVNVTPTAQLGDLGTFNLDPSNPLALFGALLSDLQAVQGVMGKFPGAGELDKPIPLIGKSFNDVVSAGASGGGDPVTWSAAGPPGTTTLVDTDKTFTEAYVGRHVHVGSTEAAIVSVDPVNPHVVVLQPALTPVPANHTSYTMDSELQGVINLLQDQSSNNLQEMLDLVAAKLGGGSTVGFQVVNGTPDQLKLIVHWKRAYHSTSALNMKFDLPSGTHRSLIGAQGQGLLDVSASGEVDLSLLIPLDTSTFGDPAHSLTIDPSGSSVKAGITVNGDGVKLAANLGPFAVSLGDPTDGAHAGTQLRAGLGVTLSSPDSSPESLADFVSGLAVTVDGDGVTCDNVSSGSDTLAACAVFPAYLNGSPVNALPTKNNFVVALPLNTTDLADTFDVTGPNLDGGNPRFAAPDGLLTALQGAALNLTTFGDGFYGYLDFVERTLRTASFDGKLPLVGKDLQAGSEFIHGLHTDMATALGGVDPTATNAGQIRTFLKDKVKPALPVLPGGGAFTFDVECTSGAGLAAVGTPTVTPTGGGSGATYQYKVVAYAAVGGDPQETVPSNASAGVSNNPVTGLDSGHHNTVSWNPVDGAGGYHVYRSVDGGDFLLVQDVTDQSTGTWDDASPHDGAALVPATSLPCPDSTPADGVQGFTMAVDIGQGDVSDASTGCVPRSTGDPGVKDCLGGHLPFDLGIPGLSISSTSSTDAENGINVALGWKLHLKVGLNRDDGFFVETQDTDKPELQVGLQVNVGNVQARLAFINIDKTKHGPAETPDFVGRFVIDLKDGPGAADCTATCTAEDGPGSPRLTLDKLTGGGDVTDFVKPLVTANVDLDWHLAARPGAESALPGISTNFLLTWAWTSAAPSDIGGLDIAFNDVKIDAGEFLGGVIKPIIQQVVDVLKPVQPVIDILFEPIPVISDLSEAVGGDPVTIASLAQTFSTLAGGPDLQPFLDVVKNVRDLVKSLSGDCGGPSPCITVGSFHLVKGTAIDTDANPATAQSLIKDSGPGYDLHSDVKNQVNSHASKPIDQNGSDTEHPGFSFPFLDHPASIFGLLVGQDVDLVKFDSGPLTLGFEFQESFGPVYAPPPVNIVVGGGASVSLRIVAGFDTYGIRTAVERGKVDAQILDSLFFYTTDDNGKPLPVVQFTGFLEAGASVSAVIIEVGVVGGIKLTISFYWNDPNNDGKFRFSEFLAAALNNPICLFNVGGELSLFVKVFITLGFSPFSVSFDFTLVDIKLLDFSLKPDCTPPPPKLGGVHGDVLYLFAGTYGTKAQRAPGYGPDYPFDNKGGTADEAWVVRQVPAVPAKAATAADPSASPPKLAQPAQAAENAKITVTALGISEDFDDSGNAIHTVVLDGRDYHGALQVTFNGGTDKQPFDKKVVVATGSGKDVVRTGIGPAVVDVGGSDDRVTTLERTDLSQDPATAPKALVSGGPGVDAISVGNGEDTVFGDRSLVFHDQGSPVSVKPASGANISLSGVLDPDNVGQPSDKGGDESGGANDQISAGLGGSTIYGNDGPDKIGTANDNPQADLPGIANPAFYRARPNTIVGGSGGDQIKSGSAADVIYTGAQDDSAKNDIGPNNTGSGDAASDENSVDTGTGTDVVYGSNAKDYVTTHSTQSQTATVYGGGADDVLIGALGTDKLYGGPGDDYLVAGPATISADTPLNDVLGSARQVTLTPVAPPVSAKTLVGGGGRDRIYGVDGPATIFGDHEIDPCTRQSDPVSAQPPEHPTTTGPAADQDAGDLILGGAGVDTVQAGGGDDHVFLAGGDDVACGNAGTDEVFGGDGADLVYGGSDGDHLYGENGSDELYGNTGDDSAYGGAQNDRIQGNEGSDFLTGGTGDDVVVGGTSKAGTPDKGDRIYGDEGNDVLIGDNGVPDPTPNYPADLANTDANPTIGGPDFVFGGAGDDRAFGGLDADNVYGGDGADYLEGNNASDHVWGEAGADDIIGGSSQETSIGSGVGRPDDADVLSGGADDDVIAGDNAQLAKVGPLLGSPLTRGRGLTSERSITLLDLGFGAASGLFGGDTITGDGENDVVLGERGADQIHGNAGDDYLEGGQDADTIDGDAGSDDIVGGEFTAFNGSGANTVGQPDTGNVIRGGTESDVVLGDNGALLRAQPGVTTSDLTKGRGITERAIQPYDLGDSPTAGTSGADLVNGNDGVDVILGQAGPDRLLADAGSDYAEGGPGTDWIEGGDGSDDLVGGSSAILSGSGSAAKGQPDAGDMVWGQAGDDVAAGDNAVITRVAPFNDLTFRIGIAGTIEERRAIRLLDLDNNGIRNAPDAIRFGADELSGQAGVDVLLGQDGNDAISGGSADDYAEGQGGDDTIYGDQQLATVGIAPLNAAWPGSPTGGYDGDGLADGQDDLIGGKSQPGFRDGNDLIHGDGSSDFVLGDNGTSVRDIRSGSTTFGPNDAIPPGATLTDRIYTVRYPSALPAGAAKVRHHDPAQSSTTVL